MSQATTSNIVKFTKLPPGQRVIYLMSATEHRGNIIPAVDQYNRPNVNAGELSRYVDMVFSDEETGTLIHKNYSLDKPSHLARVVGAITGDESALDSIDWENEQDVAPLTGIAVLGEIKNEKYDGFWYNRIGAVEALPQQA